MVFSLISAIENTNIQELVSKFLTVSQYEMPVSPILLTLCSSIESYLSDAQYETGKTVKNLVKKLNMVFNGKWQNNDSTEQIIQQIKDTRDYYVHGSKNENILSEKELIPVVEEFKKGSENIY
ncbi:HEPN domain-containing protein [Leuconostoc citreum]